MATIYWMLLLESRLYESKVVFMKRLSQMSVGMQLGLLSVLVLVLMISSAVVSV